MRVAAGRPATIRLHLTSDGGSPLNPDAGTTPAVTVTAGDGSVLYQSQPGTRVTAGSPPAPVAGEWSWALPPQSRLDSLTATWTATVGGATYTVPVAVDVVAQRLVEPWWLRQAYAEDLGSLDDETLLGLLDSAEELFRDVLGYPPVLEAARVEWDVLRGTLNDALYIAGTVNGLPYGWGAGRMLVPEVRMPVTAPPGAVYAGSINGVALDTTADLPKIKVEQGALVWSDYRPWISGRYSLWITHGEPAPPRDLRDACAKYVDHKSRTIDYPDRATQIVTEGATILIGAPTPDRPTGIPEVDAVLNRYRLESSL